MGLNCIEMKTETWISFYFIYLSIYFVNEMVVCCHNKNVWLWLFFGSAGLRTF